MREVFSCPTTVGHDGRMAHDVEIASNDDAPDDDRTKVLLVGRDFLHPPLVSALESAYATTEYPGSERAAFLSQHGHEFTVAVTTAMHGLSADEMDALPNLKFIANFGVGYDSTDVVAAAECGILVTNTPDVLNDGVADLAVGLMIDVLRGISAADGFARENRWPAGAFPLRRQVTGTKVGIVGLGRIGQAIADRLVGFRCQIGYHNRSEVTGSSLRYFAELLDLARWCDVLMVVVPGGAATRHLIDADVLAALGERGFLVNVARGSVVDEDALIDALEQGVIAGAGLDVYADEPHIPAGLRESSAVVLTPHIASGTEETRQAMADVVLANIATWVAEGQGVTPVNEVS